ncbi:hypothetical protein DV515_00005914 [Chloebia gouldiae]|uniref:Receptor activity-modifying protein 3 n=1 Tax=Chloebia gouldiae TaxID=44316 RepID=A0A3L8SM08_CHLGU|nr:hypothetical protein DV515_00005914 [Chloebia gouldiae]
MLKSPAFIVDFLIGVAITAAIDATEVLMRAWPRAGWSRVQHSAVLSGDCARWSTDLSGQLDAPPSLHGSLLNLAALSSDLLLFRYYDNFTQCTEREANNASCFWPNPLAEGFITGIHKQFFSNCTSEKVHWEDPPDEIVVTLILIPVMLTCVMITLVVWCSKRSDILV